MRIRFLILTLLISTAVQAKTITSFKRVIMMPLNSEYIFQSEQEPRYQSGYGTYYEIKFYGATCERKAKVPQQEGGIYINDIHIDLREGESAELNGILYICSQKDSIITLNYHQQTQQPACTQH